MQIVSVKTKKEKKIFKTFRKNLYKNDPYYVSTVEFTVDMLLNKETDFARSIDIHPVMGVEGDRILLTSLLIHNPKDDYLQVAFFEALENIHAEVNLFMDYVKEFAGKLNLKKIYVGLNGHLSYGVGLSVDMSCPNTFDSTYTKLYYNQYFDKYKTHDLVAFSNTPQEIFPSLLCKETEVVIRPINFKNFNEEMERFRVVCDETIGTTFLYSRTDKGHFRDLLESMTFFLKPENIMFAEYKGQVVGFIFWHPDYNEILNKGKYSNLLEIAVRYTLFKNKIKKAKLNAIGVKEEFQGIVTMNLLSAVSKYAQNYEKIETNFVWCNNKKSMAINKLIMKNIERKFAVYEVEL